MENLNQQVVDLWLRFDAVWAAANERAGDFEFSKRLLWDCSAAQKTADKPEAFFLKVDQFLIAAASLRHAQGAREVSDMGSWAAWAVADELVERVSEGQPMGMWRFVAFRSSEVVWDCPAFRTACLYYFCGLYDFARERSGYKEICRQTWRIASYALQEALHRPPEHIELPAVYMACCMLVWAARESRGHAKGLAKGFEAAVDDAELPEWVRATCCKVLSTTASKFTSQSAEHWAKRALVEFSDWISDFDKIQMTASSLPSDDSCRAEAEALLSKMAAIQAERSSGKTALAALREAAQSVQFIQPYFDRMLQLPAADLLLRGLQVWYRQDDGADPLHPNTIVFWMPFGLKGSLMLRGAEASQVTRDSQALLVEMNSKMAEFLQTYTTVAGADNSVVPVPKRPGVVCEHMPGLAEILRETYCPEGLSASNDPTAQLILPMEGHPIQATQLSTWGRTWPIASSLNQPRPDRPPQSVLLWRGAVFGAEMELAMVQAAFERAGAKVKVVSPGASSAADFLLEYENGSYDVVWIASHGDFDHWAPHQVKLHLAHDGSTVMLDDLWNKAPASDGRRLLVLNVCDGARFAGKGLLPRIGLAAGLSCPSQATISHLWPVAPLPSAAFGVYLAHYVAQGLPYFDAYCATLKSLQQTAVEVGFDLEAKYGAGFTFVDRLRASDLDFSRIETWGSAAFYQ